MCPKCDKKHQHGGSHLKNNHPLPSQDTKTEFPCSYIRVGNFGVENPAEEVVVSTTSIVFKIPGLNNSKPVPIVILSKDLIRVEGYFTTGISLINLVIGSHVCKKISQKLGMTDHKSYNFNSKSVKEEERRILLFAKQAHFCHVNRLKLNFHDKLKTLSKYEFLNICNLAKVEVEELSEEIKATILDDEDSGNILKDTSKVYVGETISTHPYHEHILSRSFHVLFQDKHVHKDQFDYFIENVSSMKELIDAMRSIGWTDAVVHKEMEDYVATLRCWCCEKSGKNGVLKCGDCKEARYCNTKCQQKDLENHQNLCQSIKIKRKAEDKLEKERKNKNFGHISHMHGDEVFFSITFDYFIKKVRSKLHHFLRKELTNNV